MYLIVYSFKNKDYIAKTKFNFHNWFFANLELQELKLQITNAFQVHNPNNNTIRYAYSPTTEREAIGIIKQYQKVKYVSDQTLIENFSLLKSLFFNDCLILRIFSLDNYEKTFRLSFDFFDFRM